MQVAELAQKRWLVVTGKGGAGKSLLSLALAHRLATQGKRVWLVELGRQRDRAFTRLPELVGRKKLAHEATWLKPPGSSVKISVSVLDPTLCLSEYVDLKLPTGGLAGMLLNNKVTSSFLEVVPGLPDLVALGKIWHALENPGEQNSPDTVILDAPASGHALALLHAPANFQKITRVGPIYRDAKKMQETLSDPEKTAVLLVTLPEEMSLQETRETAELLQTDLPAPHIFVNKCFPALPKEKVPAKATHPAWAAYEYARNRYEREQAALRDFSAAADVQLPFVFPDPEAPELYLQLSEELAP